MRGDEARAVGNLIGSALGGVSGFLHETHHAISRRPFEALGAAAAPVRLIHDPVARMAYRAVGAALAAPPKAAARLLADTLPPEAQSLARGPGGSISLGALNGAIGDALARHDSPLALPMTIRRSGDDVPTTRADLARAYPDATRRVAVFVHGLCETDEAWYVLPLAREGQTRSSYGSRLRADLGYTPVYVRYNTGLHVSDNGRRLAALLKDLVGSWPVPVDEVALIGHSMGGLVARSACHYGTGAGAQWTRLLRHVFCLGSPHLGAPLEKLANVASYALSRLPETRPLARVFNGRSVGIKDMRFGSCVEEDWCDCDIDEFLRDRCREVPFLDSVAYYFVAATLSRSSDGVVGSVAGDLLVRLPSASGRGRRRHVPFELERGRHVGGINHFQLLNHPAVYEQIRAWLGTPLEQAVAATGAS